MLKDLYKKIVNFIPTRLILFFIGWIGLSITALVLSLVFQAILPLFFEVNADETLLDFPVMLSAINFFSYLTVLIILLIILKAYVVSLLKSFINIESLFKGTFLGFAVIMLGISINLVYQTLNITIADNLNQATIVALVETTPIFSLLTFTLLGPIVEEITYRLGLFSYLKRRNRWIAYIVTPLIFAFIHFNFVADSLVNELFNLPFYLSAGVFFCWIYEKYGFATVTIAHITNNLVSFLVIIFAAQQGLPSS